MGKADWREITRKLPNLAGVPLAADPGDGWERNGDGVEEAEGIDSASEYLGAVAVSVIQVSGWEGRGPGGAGGPRPLDGPHSVEENASPLKSRGPPTSPEPEPEPEPRC